MSTLALLRDLAACRAVLHDAREQRHDGVAELEAVLVGSEERVWGGAEVERVDAWVYRRSPPLRPSLDLAAFRDAMDEEGAWEIEERGRAAADPGPAFAAEHRAWADDSRRAYRDGVRAYLATEWTAWDDRTARTRGGAWARQGGFYGVDLTSFDGVLRDAYSADSIAYMAARPSPILVTLTNARKSIANAQKTVEITTGAPDSVFMSPSTMEALERQARVMGTGVFAVPAGARRASFRPSWAPSLAATLASVIHPPPPTNDGVEAILHSYANEIVDSPMAVIPGDLA